jgi:hypothetical protein
MRLLLMKKRMKIAAQVSGKRVTKKERSKKEDPITVLARDMCIEYYTQLNMAAASAIRSAIPIHSYISTTLELQSSANRTAFRNAATAMLAVKAEPGDFIRAQFERFRELQAYRKRMFPRPGDLGTDTAKINYLQHQMRLSEKSHRSAPQTERMHAGFGREERKLKGLMSMFSVTEEMIFDRKASEFSRAFLEHRGVWAVVKHKWSGGE